MDKPVEIWSLIIALLVFVMSSVKGEIRCYCNQAACVSTGYMCKSGSMCFSDFGSGLYGCVEKKKRCLPGPPMHCCDEDMCNYAHVDMHFKTPPVTGALEDDPSDENRIALLESSMRREVWFRAAVIATPIAGICILALLALAAARMLRQDALRQRRLHELRRIYGCSLPETLLLPPWQHCKGGKSATVV